MRRVYRSGCRRLPLCASVSLEFFVKFADIDLTPTGNIANMVKDLGTAVAAARSAGLTLTVTDAVLAQNEALVAQGYAQGDNANLMRLYNQVP